jgi:site-specific DNA-methyltransferase (adenine-specific)
VSFRTEQLAEGVTLYCGDCRGLLAELPRSAAVVSDVPYGMSWDTDSTRFSGGDPSKNNRGRGDGRSDWGAIPGDNEPFDPEPWLAFDEAILWGSNHYAARLPVGTTLVWLKKPPHLYGTFLSDAEVGFKKGGYGVYCHFEQFPPPSRIAEHDGKSPAHPTQKPIGLMAWCVDLTKSSLVIDPYMGSGSTGVAAVRRGRQFIGIELQERFFDTACRRIEATLKQPDMFIEPPKPLKQDGLFDAA